MTCRAYDRSLSGWIALVLGTRPEMVKLARIINLLGPDASVIYTGQHHSPAMSTQMQQALRLPPDNAKLGIGGRSRGSQLGLALTKLDQLFESRPPQAVVVQGDTTSALAGALAANARDVPVVHVEAGLRSFDRRMPEEHNRVLIDHLADMCCAPNDMNRNNLLAEGIADERIAVTGNTVVEAVLSSLPPPRNRLTILSRRGLRHRNYVLLTLHRPENVDDPVTLGCILKSLATLPVQVLFPVHPRTLRRIAEYGIDDLLRPLDATEPLNYPDFLAVAKEAAFIVTDSGGLQEEASVLKCPIVVIRRSTERPEIEGVFGVRQPPGPELESVFHSWLATAAARRAYMATASSPYGDGFASHRIVHLVRALLQKQG